MVAKFKKRREGKCEVCGNRGCPACSETELFRSLGISDFEVIDEPAVWKLLEDQIDAIKAEAVAFRMNPKQTAPVFAKAVNKLMLVFEEICHRRHV